MSPTPAASSLRPFALDWVARRPLVRIERRGGGWAIRGPTQGMIGHAVDEDGVEGGAFARWAWDGRRIEATNDRLGLCPIYYAAGDDVFRLSPSVARLVEDGADATTDGAALSVFLRAGFFVGERTPFASIRALPPGSTLTWDGALSVVSRAKPAVPVDVSGRDELRAEYRDRFARAIARRLAAGLRRGLPLSGGRDSRHIAVELVRQGAPPDVCVTLGGYPPRADETPYAAAFCAAAGLRHVALDSGPRLDAELARNVMLDFCTDEHAWALTLAQWFPAEADVAYDGIGGGILTSGSLVKPRMRAAADRGDWEPIAIDLLRWPRRARLPDFLPFGPEPRDAPDRAVAMVTEELKRTKDWPDPMKAFFFRNRTRREVALVPGSLYADLKACYCPYLDREMHDFFMGVDGRRWPLKGLHDDVLREADPARAAVPFLPRSRRPVLRHRLDLMRSVAAYAQSVDPRWWGRRRGRVWAEWVRWLALPTREKKARGWLDPCRILYLLHLKTFAETRRVDAGLGL